MHPLAWLDPRSVGRGVVAVARRRREHLPRDCLGGRRASFHRPDRRSARRSAGGSSRLVAPRAAAILARRGAAQMRHPHPRGGSLSRCHLERKQVLARQARCVRHVAPRFPVVFADPKPVRRRDVDRVARGTDPAGDDVLPARPQLVEGPVPPGGSAVAGYAPAVPYRAVPHLPRSEREGVDEVPADAA